MLMLLAGGLVVGWMLLTGTHDSWFAWYVALVLFVAGAGALAWWDIYGFAVLVVAMSGAYALFQLLFSFTFALPPLRIALLSLPWIIGIAAGIPFLVWTRRLRDPIPDILRSMFRENAIAERNGVQISYRAPTVLATSAIVPVEVLLQNCRSEPRTVEISFAEAPLFPSKPKLLSRSPVPIVLGGSEVKRVLLPVCSSITGRAFVQGYVKLRVSGRGGRRTRRWYAQPFQAPRNFLLILLAMVLLLPLGVLLIVIRRGGVVMQIVPGGPLRAPQELPDPTLETVWSVPVEPAVRPAA
jgi:hypothetical protein